MGIIVVKEIIVLSDSFQITKYYFFGFIKRKWKFDKSETIYFKSYGSGFGREGDIPNLDDSASGLGCLFTIFCAFVEPPLITKKEFTIEMINDSNVVIKGVQIFLNEQEFIFLQTFFN